MPELESYKVKYNNIQDVYKGIFGVGIVVFAHTVERAFGGYIQAHTNNKRLKYYAFALQCQRHGARVAAALFFPIGNQDDDVAGVTVGEVVFTRN
jgi:hypothetical protein